MNKKSINNNSPVFVSISPRFPLKYRKFRREKRLQEKLIAKPVYCFDVDRFLPGVLQFPPQFSNHSGNITVPVKLDAPYPVADLLRGDHDARIPDKVM